MEELQNKLKDLEISLFEKSLPLIFTDREIEIIKKRLNKQALNKTEIEVFSRYVKKKIVAIQILKDLNLILY